MAGGLTTLRDLCQSYPARGCVWWELSLQAITYKPLLPPVYIYN